MRNTITVRYAVLAAGLLVFLLVPAAGAATPVSHPALLFHDISETPGFQYSTIDPWKSWQQSIMSEANVALTKDFSTNMGAYDRVFYRADFARDAGFAYQITKNPDYAKKAQEALLHLDTGTVTMPTDNALALGSYAVAYDLVQPTLDPGSDATIRDKLATLADTVYKSLNDNGTKPQYVSFADYHGQEYPMVGIASAALTDYTNPNHLPLSSTPDDWLKVGTDYLFVDDKLHMYNRSLFSFGFDEESGKHLNGAYKSYVIEDFAWWLQIYNHFYHVNPFEKYPAAEKAFTSETWESLPNLYGNDYVTSGNLKWTYHRDFASLMNDSDRSHVLNFDERLESENLLPYSQELGGGAEPVDLLYSTFGNYNSLPRSFPETTSHLDPAAVFQVIRSGWQGDADWMSMVTWNVVSNSNRDMAHMDQMGIEYYSRGDLLLADAGENKYVLDMLYGENEIHHNTVAIEDPRTPFPPASWSGSAARGIYKGDSYSGVVTPVTVPAVIEAPWITGIDVHADITTVMGDSYGQKHLLSSPVRYSRTVLYPESGYFLIIDRFEGTEPWIYDTIFRPTSLVTTPSIMVNHNVAPSDVGHVNGQLTLDGKDYDWLSQPYKSYTTAPGSTGSIGWSTTNPYGRSVGLDIFSAPSSEIGVDKLVGRIGGYDGRSEVFSPVLFLRAPPENDLYRITALLSGYPDEPKKTAEEIPVTGNGRAIRVSASGGDDYVYAGDGTAASFGGYSTDAEVAMVRTNATVTEVTLIGGSYLSSGSDQLVALSEKVSYFTARKTPEGTDRFTSGDAVLQANLFGSNPGVVTPGPSATLPVVTPPATAQMSGSFTATGPDNAPGPASGAGQAGLYGTVTGWIKSILKQLLSPGK
ncbi:MAG TPA: hypothetical protein VMT44_03455 [Methanoregula sp.]|nr:hypothetical protein [Methanoregula sp.]